MSDLLPGSLAGELLGLAFCISLGRPDGVKVGLTTHDRAILAGGLRFEPRAGLVPSAILMTASMRPDQMELAGAVGEGWLSEFDLDCGRWRGGRVEVSLCEWSSDPVQLLPLFAGVIAGARRSVAEGQAAIVLELLSDMAIAGRETLPVCSPLCRAELGDRWCGVDLDRHRREVEVLAGEGRIIQLADGAPDLLPYVAGGLRFLTGPLAGVDRRILSVGEGVIWLDEEAGPDGAGPCRALLTEGCDRRLATCHARFGNVAAFLGEPHVPGTDALVRFGDG